jgi:hypothetical protein
MNSPALDIVREAWSRVQNLGPAWLWFAHGMKNGDLYHACSLARAFRETHGADLPIRIIVDSTPQFEVVKLFGEHVADVIHMGEFSISADLWAEFLREEQLSGFGPARPVILHPLRNPQTRALGGFVAENGLTWMALYRQILGLEGTVEPAVPRRYEARAAEALALCDRHGIRPGRSVIFFPYAQSFPVSGEGHFMRLAERLCERGLDVFTSVAGREQPIPTTTPVTIPFSLLPDVAEQAGWVVAVRSGICDIVAHTRARKSFIFRHGRELPLWGTGAMGLCRDAHEIPFDTSSRSPDDFADTILADAPNLPPVRAACGISDELSGIDGPVLTRSIVPLQRAQADLGRWAEPLLRHVGAEGAVAKITDLPERDHARWGALVSSAIEHLLSRSDTATHRFHACRDRPGQDAFEPVTPAALMAAHYHAAAFWHTIIVTRGIALADCLPWPSRGRILPDTPVTIGEPVMLADGWGGPDIAAYGDGVRPLSYRGLQLLDGWYEPEPWGLWSKGCLSRLKVAVAEPLPAGTALRLDCDVAVSGGFPELRIETVVNGRPNGHTALRAGDRLLTIPLPAGETGSFLIEIRLAGVRSPRAQGTGPDDRLLGIGLHAGEIVTPPA